MSRTTRAWLLAALAWLAPARVAAQDPPQSPPEDASEERSTGLPASIEWTFNFDAGWGTFGFGNSLFDNPREEIAENLSDQWFEGYVKPGLSAVYTFASSSQVYGKASALGERTYGSMPGTFGEDVSSFQAEDLSIGWRSGTWLPLGEHALDFAVGRLPYKLGHGMLLYDGAAEGGSRGGYWTNARWAFEFGAVGRFKPGPHMVDVFYLDRDDLPERETGTRLWGTNYEFGPSEDTTLGATYMKWAADAGALPGRTACTCSTSARTRRLCAVCPICQSSSSTRRSATARRSTRMRGRCRGLRAWQRALEAQAVVRLRLLPGR